MSGDNGEVTTLRRTTARRAERQRRLERRRRRAVVTATATLSACIMIVGGAFLTAGADGARSDPQAQGPGTIVAEEEPTCAPGESAEAGRSCDPTPDAAPVDDATDGEGDQEPSADQQPFCSTAVEEAIDSGDAEAVVVAAGGGQAFRDGVISGRADDCIALNHPAWDWVVVNKHRPVEPVEYAPNVVRPETYSPIGAHLDPAAASALDALAQGVRESGTGEIGLQSGYRSYDTQVQSYNGLVSSRGSIEAADLTSARPGFSEHQLGLAADLVACNGTACGSMYDFGASPQGQWVAENAWRYGWIVRYESHMTDTTGYEPEPWHLRYVGVELATAYHDGGYKTYEEFWDLPAAPDYVDN